MKIIELVYFNAGDGHRMTAQAIEAVVREQGLAWQVRLTDLAQVLDPRGSFRSATGLGLEDFYNRRLARGWSIGLTQELKLLQGLIRLGHRPIVRQLRRHWAKSAPDMVVSLVPNFNRPLYQSVLAALPGVPYVTILTDIADYPPNFWIEKDQAQHLICGSAKAVEQARACGYPEARIHATSGMIIRPGFYRPSTLDRAAERCKLGLDPRRLTGIVMFGGHGSRAMRGIARRLEDLQLILVCGHNRVLAEKLRALPCAAPRCVVEFSAEIQYYMHLSDFFVGKPGPGALSEAVQLQLPVIVACNAWTRPQERYNAQWITEHNVGLVLESFADIDAAAQRLTARLEQYRSSMRCIENRAVFEVPAILERIALASQRLPRPLASRVSGVSSLLH